LSYGHATSLDWMQQSLGVTGLAALLADISSSIHTAVQPYLAFLLFHSRPLYFVISSSSVSFPSISISLVGKHDGESRDCLILQKLAKRLLA